MFGFNGWVPGRVLLSAVVISRAKATCRLVLITGLMVVVVNGHWSEAQSVPPPESTRWPPEGVMATLIAKITRPIQNGRDVLQNDSNIIFGNVPAKFSPVGATVLFPFRVVFEDDGKCGAGISFNITVRRRGLALTGVPQSLEIIRQNSPVVLRLPEERPPHEQQNNCLVSRGPVRHVEQEFDVAVTLPGGVNFVEIIADIDFGPGNEKLDVRKKFPSKDCEQPAFDHACMLIAVAPTAVVIPDVIPLTIIYEPPGHCSFATVQHNSSAGVQMALTEAGAEERRALIDIKSPIFNTKIEQSDTVQVQVRNLERISRFEFSSSRERGTAFSREQACENYRQDPGKHGPGLGDRLVFITHPQFFYWDTASLSNYRYPEPSDKVCPGEPKPSDRACTPVDPARPLPTPKIEFAFAWELRDFLITEDNRILPQFLRSATTAQIRSLARLDPFIRLPPTAPPKPGLESGLPRLSTAEDCQGLGLQDIGRARCVRDVLKAQDLDKQRFVDIGVPECEQFRDVHTSGMEAKVTKFSGTSLSTRSTEEPGKTSLRLGIQGIARAGGGVAKLLGAGISPEIIEEGLNAVVLGFKDDSKITTTVTMTRNEAIDTVTGNRYTQTLHFEDKDPHACAAFYYDKIFGTIAGRLLPGAVGKHSATRAALSTRDQLIETASIAGGSASAVSLSQGNLDFLTSQMGGGFSFALADDNDYDVAVGMKKGLPNGLTLNRLTGALSGIAQTEGNQIFQALMVVSDASDADVASIWVNLQAVPPPNTCKVGFVWREANQTDFVCVTGETRTQAHSDNSQAEARRNPNGGPFGPDTCLEGFVWREAFVGDHVCVTGETREQTIEDNRVADSRRQLSPNTCKVGFVWREANQTDFVCVTAETRAQAQDDNSQADARRNPDGGPHGPDTCFEGFVWREAFPGDHVCVTGQTRDQVAEDNRLADSRRLSFP